MTTRSEGEGRVEPLIELSFFGIEEARLRGQPVGLSGPNLHAVAVLAVHAEAGVPTDELMGLLWSSGSAEDLRARLRQVRYTVRRTFSLSSGLIRYEGARHFLDRKLIWSDLDRLEELLQRKAVLEAVELLCLGFLPSARSEGTRPLEAWVAEQERDMRARTRVAAARLWSEATGRADWDVAAEAARASLLLDPMEEANLRRLMEALAFTDRLEEASAEFRSFQERAEAGGQCWEPEPATLQFRANLPDLVRRRLDSVLFRRVEGLTDPPLVGRDPELTRIGSALLHPPEDAVQVISISGETGIGKTRLAEEAIARALLRGSRILTAQCTELEQDLCLAPLISAMSEEWIVEEIYGLPAFWRDILLRLAPELRRPHADPHDTSSLAPSQVRRLAVEAFCRLFTRMAASTHVILFVDDVHWADESTLLVLEHLKSRWRSGSLSMVVTEGEGGGKESVAGEGKPEARVTDIDLSPLDSREIRAIWRHFFPGSTRTAATLEEGPAFRALVWLSAGLPDHLIVWMSKLKSQLDQDASTSASDLPDRVVRNILEGRMRSLAPIAKDILEVVACLERTVSVRELTAILRIAPQDMEGVLQALLQSRLLRFHQNRLELPHPVLREIVLETTPTVRRRNWHSRIADTLATEDFGQSPPERALHLFLSGRGLEAVDRTLALADAVHDRRQAVSTIRLLSMALHEDLDPLAEAQFRLKLGELFTVLGEIAQAETHLQFILQRKLHTADPRLEFRTRLASIELNALKGGYVGRDTVTSVSQLIEDSLNAMVCDYLPRALELELRVRSRRGDYAGVRSTLDRLPSIIAGVSPTTAARIGSMRFLQFLFGDEGDLGTQFFEIYAGLDATEDKHALLQTLNGLLILGIQLGRLNSESGMALRRRAAPYLSERDNPEIVVKIASNLALWHLETADLAGAESAFDRATAIMQRYPLPAGRTTLLVNLGELQLQARDYEQATGYFEQALDQSPSHDREPAHLLATAGLALSSLGNGRLRAAMECVGRLQPISSWHPFDHALLAKAEGRILAASGDRDVAASRLAEAAATLRGRFNLGWVHLELERLRISGEALESTGEVEAFLDAHRLPHLMSRLRALKQRAAQNSVG